MRVAETLTSNIDDVALIFEGGGMRVAYTAAVVQMLLAEGLHFDWVAGISAGSSNLVNYLSRDPERARKSFVDFASDPNFGNLGTFLRGKGMFNAEYIYEHTSAPGQVLPLDFETFTANPARARIGAFECDTGRAVYWTKDDVPTLVDLVRRVRSSSTMPVVMPKVHLDGHVYVDGALGPSGGIALDAAKADGFTKFFVVLSQERGYVKKPASAQWASRAYFRGFPAAVVALSARHLNYNRTREELFDLEAAGQAYLFVPEKMPIANGTRDVAALQAAFDAGLDQARREVPKWREFLGR
ncbi:MAG: patatin family protein [Actinobacteria bacterium]|nr:patatin family protein [Propionicimonas sp.]MBU3976402.1 patatin family protein [Actinomycetota bacterium]MBU3987559.1 patatin family protein [Actinomycetota bacterium]MBU4006496.1 patatin family protein [Actinomycetota bacterium]MBU4065101.1 patatin family protein [Actinomycetota bacterium]MBU4092189.1 patatin family protein [Actinomycetota bacterium]